MRYYVTLEGRSFTVDLNQDGILVDGQPITVELNNAQSGGIRRLVVDGRSHALHLSGSDGKGEWDFHLDGERFTASAENERKHAIAAMTGASNRAQGPKPVKAPMPGLVVRVEVQPGDEVLAGQGVVIIEAMKMENELRAETAGRVSKVHVNAGQPVEKGALLIEFGENGVP
jgi:biotin carboxyl carrier protein